MTYARGALGNVFSDLFDQSAARQHLEQALALARETGSWHWIRTISGFLASLCISQNDLANAQAVLDAVPSPDDLPETLGHRLVYCARVELALTRGDPQRALEIINQLIASAANAKPDGSNILRVSMLRGQTLAALGRFAEAEAALLAACEIAQTQGALPLLWQINAALGKLHRSKGHAEQAEAKFAAARAILDELANQIADEALRRDFVRGAREAMA
jgi:tetratricopeptide (TPR) repeat protein